MMFVGIMISALTFGVLADKYGRKHMLMTCIAITVFSAMILAFVNNFWLFLIFQTLVALGQAGVFLVGFILAVESVGKSKRVFCGIVIEFFFVAGEVVLTLTAMTLRSWRWILGSALIPLSLTLLAWPLLPESVRWLLAQGQDEEAERLVLKMAKVNKIPNFDLENHRKNSSDEGQQQVRSNEGLWDIIKTWPLFLRFVNACFCWMTVTMVYYGLSFNATNLAGSPYTNFLLVSLVEIPGYSLSYFTMEKMGRKKSTSLSLLIGGVCCILSAVLVEYGNSVQALGTATFLLGKLGVTWTFGNIYVYTSGI
jgi:OCT family organic cation transporter-like MFS transporter 4/5